jgi:hypothetical protein
MLAQYLLAGLTFTAVFILFLVLARTLNTIINLLVKLEYLVQKEYDLKQEQVEVRRMMEQRAAERNARNEEPPGEPESSKSARSSKSAKSSNSANSANPAKPSQPPKQT